MMCIKHKRHYHEMRHPFRVYHTYCMWCYWKEMGDRKSFVYFVKKSIEKLTGIK